MPAILPWLIGASAFAFYLTTLNPWVSVASALDVARASGWAWQPDIFRPLDWLVRVPFHWLPTAAIPVAMNLFVALCAALTLCLLARSVALLPRDKTQEQRDREHSAFSLLSGRNAWLPPVLAVFVCGLQLTFWEAASSFVPPGGAGCEMLDLLAFAYIIRCLLEFRIDERQTWLSRAAFVMGLAMTNNWGMIGFFPVFLAALIWLKGVGFFNMQFFGRMVLFGLAGLSLYLLLPVVQVVTDSPLGFWQALKANFAGQYHALTAIPFSKSALIHGIMLDERPLWILALWSLLPVLVMAIRWPSYFGDPSPLGVALTTLIFHFFHALVLLVTVLVALDPVFSPRHFISAQRLDAGMPTLSLYYLGALCVGYYSGYFLLVFRPKRSRSGGRPAPSYLRLLHSAAVAAVYLLALVVVPILFLHRNLPQIRVTNGPWVKQFAAFQAQGLPSKGAVLISDNPLRLLLLESYLNHEGRAKNCLLLDSVAFKNPQYHRFLRKHFGRRWPFDPPKDLTQLVPNLTMLNMVSTLAQTNELYYLHPSFGYYFEPFYSERHGLLYQLRPFPTNSLFAPPLEGQIMEANEAFWDNVNKEALGSLVSAISPPRKSPPPAFLDRVLKRFYLEPERNSAALALAALYSQTLNDWGVRLQQNDMLAAAGKRFDTAQRLNPDNVVAQVNLDFNRKLQAGRQVTVQINGSFADRLGKYRTLQQAMLENGPYDEPSFCYEQAKEFLIGNNLRQSAEWFERVKTLAPQDFSARLLLAHCYVRYRMPDQALRVVQEIHQDSSILGLTLTNMSELLMVEASARLDQGDLQGTDKAVKALLQKYPRHPLLLFTATKEYMDHRAYSNALVVIEQQLSISPTNVEALVNKGFSCLQVAAYRQAIPPLTRAMELETNTASDLFNSALLNRAIAYLHTDQLDAAQHDYEALQKNYPTAFAFYYPLAEIAYRKRDTNAAIRSYELYLTNCAPEGDVAKLVTSRLKELQAGTK